MTSLNLRAVSIVRHMIEECDALGLRVLQLKNGATVVDAGIRASGSFEAGRLFACACLGGLGQVQLTHRSLDSGLWLPFVDVHAQSPHLACMASQYAGWAVKVGGFFAIGSGPARALYANEEIFRKLDYREKCETAVLMLEGRTLPDEAVAGFVAEKCGVQTHRLILAIAPTASLVGAVQVAARSAETCMHKMSELGFDVRRITAISGQCPLAPVAAEDVRAIGRTNDAILYGSRVFLVVRADDKELEDLIEKIPSSSSRDYGTPFFDLFRRCNGDFYRMDRMLFSPACVEINNLESGRTFRAGSLNLPLLQASLLEG